MYALTFILGTTVGLWLTSLLWAARHGDEQWLKVRCELCGRCIDTAVCGECTDTQGAA